MIVINISIIIFKMRNNLNTNPSGAQPNPQPPF